MLFIRPRNLAFLPVETGDRRTGEDVCAIVVAMKYSYIPTSYAPADVLSSGTAASGTVKGHLGLSSTRERDMTLDCVSDH